MKKTIIVALFMLFSNAFLSNISYAQDTLNALKALQIKPKVEIIPFQTKTELGSAITFRVRVTNLTDSYIAVKRIQLVMPPDYISAFNEDFQKEIEKKTLKDSEKGLEPGSEWQCIITIPTKRSFWQVFDADYLVFTPSEYEIHAIVSYRVPPGKETDTIESTKISIVPTLLSIMLGGVIGSLLLNAFLCVNKYKTDKTDHKLRSTLLKFICGVSKGSISSIVILLLMSRLKDLPLPINFAITDFYGGVALGLISLKLSKWIYKFLTEKVNGMKREASPELNSGTQLRNKE